MKYAVHSDAPDALHTSGVDGCEPVLIKLANGAHAMAQPLALLRFAVELGDQEQATEADLRRYFGLANEHLKRLCANFQSLQQLIDAAQEEVTIASVDVAEIVATAVEDWRPVFEDAGVRLRADFQNSSPHWNCDERKTMRALHAVLGVAASISSADELVEVQVENNTLAFEITVKNRQAGVDRLSSSELLALDVADTNMKRQRGEFKSAEDMFQVTLGIPHRT